LPPGIKSVINDGTITISGTPFFNNVDYNFSVFTSDGNSNCDQISEKITLIKKELPFLSLISGTSNQTIILGDPMKPIIFSYGGSTTSVTITGFEPQDISQSGNTITIFSDFKGTGANNGTITTISSGGCSKEITLDFSVIVNPAIISAAPIASTGGDSSGGASSLTNGNLTLNGGTCRCPNASVGDTETINGTVYTVVNNSTIADQISNGNVNLCTTLVTDMNKLFYEDSTFNSDISFWDTSNVTNFSRMFYKASAFNQNIGVWDITAANVMESMFTFANSFNQNLSNWDMGSNVTTNIFDMFAYTNSFNNGGVALTWDVSNITAMQGVFYQASAFNQDISGWCVSNFSSEPPYFSQSSALQNANKPVWGTCP
jgi:surface protein